jgi:indole-3-acetate monooxygenase
VPRDRGGFQADLLTVLRVIELVAEGDGATGWNLTQTLVGQQFVWSLPPAGIDEIYAAGPNVIFSGTARPVGGRAIAVPGGYRVSGSWSFGSGSAESDWMLQGCEVYDGETQRLDHAGQPVRIRAFARTAECVIQDTWQVTGLRGTGSNDWSLDDVFVPQRRTQPASLHPTWPGSGPIDSGGIYAPFGSVALGIARAAIGALTELATEKTPRAATVLLREQPEVQQWLGKAEALVSSAQAWRDVVTAETWQVVTAGASLSLQQRARIRLCQTLCVDNAIEAVDLLYRAAGTTSLRLDHVLGRCWRDVHAVGQNFNAAPEFYAIAGRALLGLDPGPKLR